MSSKVVSNPKLIGSNYLSWKRKIIDVFRSKNVWRLAKGDQTKLVNSKDLEIWEDRCDQVRGLIGQIVSNNL